MKVEKVINNNLVRSRDEAGREVLVMGKGLGFKKKPGDPIDRALVEKMYALVDLTQRRRLEEILSQTPLPCIQAANAVVDRARQVLDAELPDSIYLTLCDHIQFALQRFREGIELKNALLEEIRSFYGREYQVGQEALAIIEDCTGVRLPEDEAGFITLHVVNAALNMNNMGNTQEMMKIIQNIVQIVKYHFHRDLDPSSIHYERFITHLKYFVQRVLSGKELDENDDTFFLMIKNQYREEYLCVLKIYDYILKEYRIALTNDEIMYLIIHIRRIMTK